MIYLSDLTGFLDNNLKLREVTGDPSNNGLQVEGNEEIHKIICSVDISRKLIDIANERDSDFIFVHHGLSWGSSLKYISNYNATLVRPLIKNDISLYAAHLPLDAHPELGHNALLSNFIRMQNLEPFAIYGGIAIGTMGILKEPKTAEALASNLFSELQSLISSYSSHSEPCELKDAYRVIGASKMINSVGIVSGSGGSDCLKQAISNGLDCFITGEISHSMYHLAAENDIAVIAPGHYNTEVPGVVAIMDTIKNNFDVELEFINIPTGI